MKQMLFKPFN